MNIAQYENRRNELIRMINTALQKIYRIPADTVEGLKDICRKVMEDQFRIVLISGFEQGKSTTFNALCDGIEVSPRGAMIRTSATVISAQNTEDENLLNTVKIVWRTDRELITVFAKYLLQTFRGMDEDRFLVLNHSEQLPEALKFPEDLPLLEEAVKRRLHNATMLTDLSIEEEEAMLMALVICKFYESDDLKVIKERESFPLADIGNMVCFPQNWSEPWLENWKKNGEVPFSLKDCLFLFVKEARVYIKSKRLRQAGCVIVDCPGLYASDYDTKVAFDLLEGADAVWYILSDRGLSQTDMDSIQSLETAKPGKVFYSINTRDDTMVNVCNTIIPNDIYNMRRLGIAKKQEDFFVYQAQLALISAQAEKIINGSLDEHTKNAIDNFAKRKLGRNNQDIQDVLSWWAEDSLRRNCGFYEGLDLFDKNSHGIQILEEKCGFAQIISMIENYIIQQKASSILIDMGTQKLRKILDQIEANLRIAEEMADKNEDEMERQFQSTQEKLNKFNAFCEKQLGKLSDENGGEIIDSVLANDYLKKVIIDSINEVAHKAAVEISNTNFNDVRTEMCQQIVNDVFSDVVLPKAVAWVNDIKQGNNESFNHEVMTVVKEIQEKTEQQWKQVIREQPLLEGLPVPTPIIGMDAMSVEFIDDVVAKIPSINIRTYAKNIGYGATIGGVIGTFVFPSLGTAAGAAIGGALGGFLANSETRHDRVNQLEIAIADELRKNLAIADDKNELLKKQKKRVRGLRYGVIKAFKNDFNVTKDAFDARRQEAKDLHNAELSRRKKLKDESKALRAQVIAPLYADIQEFEKQVREECKEII